MEQKSSWLNIDWYLILMYLALICIGWVNIYSSEVTKYAPFTFDFSYRHGKQLVWIICALVIALSILLTNFEKYWRYSDLIYLATILLLAVLFVLGKQVNGARSWIALGSFKIQPSEFAKISTALMIARFFGDMTINKYRYPIFLKPFLVILLPSILILLQPDPGTALIFVSFVLVFYREGLSGGYLLIGILLVALFLLVVAFDAIYILVPTLLILLLFYFFQYKKKRIIFLLFSMGVALSIYLFSIQYIFKNVLAERHQNRINIVLGKAPNTDEFRRGIGYNLDQSLTAIGSGGLYGKGYMAGTLTKGDFVPEQSTDYIFCTIGEEWGFFGSMGLVFLYLLLIARIFYLAEKQYQTFARVYGYCVGSILLFHVAINIGMTIGLIPTIGIPLPFVSYGGSSLWGFTILLFLFIRLDWKKKRMFLGSLFQ